MKIRHVGMCPLPTVCLVLCTVACNQILGVAAPGPHATDATTRDSTDAALVVSSPPDANVPLPDLDSSVECEFGATQCRDGVVSSCRERGSWSPLRRCERGCAADSCAVTIEPQCSAATFRPCHGNIIGSWRVASVCADEAWSEARALDWFNRGDDCEARILRASRSAVGQLRVAPDYSVTGHLILTTSATLRMSGQCDTTPGATSIARCDALKANAEPDQVIVDSCRPSGMECLCSVHTPAERPWSMEHIASQLLAGLFCTADDNAILPLGPASQNVQAPPSLPMQLLLVR